MSYKIYTEFVPSPFFWNYHFLFSFIWPFTLTGVMCWLPTRTASYIRYDSFRVCKIIGDASPPSNPSKEEINTHIFTKITSYQVACFHSYSGILLTCILLVKYIQILHEWTSLIFVHCILAVTPGSYQCWACTVWKC